MTRAQIVQFGDVTVDLETEQVFRNGRRVELSAREFAADALRGINGDDARSAGLRDTLSAYFKAGQNASSTAAALRVHEATIARRLSEVEKRTGQRVNQRRAELETALRLRRLLD